MALVNFITLYRIVTAPLLLYLAIRGEFGIFKWLLIASFLTDAVDGIIARKLKAVSVLGARLDSIGDDLTFFVAVMGLLLYRPDFFSEQWHIIGITLALFLVQLAYALIKYGKMTSFHTYAAKIAAVLQAIFLISSFFLPEVSYPLFYAAAVATTVDLLEETALVKILPEWRSDVRGMYWVMKTLRK